MAYKALPSPGAPPCPGTLTLTHSDQSPRTCLEQARGFPTFTVPLLRVRARIRSRNGILPGSFSVPCPLC